MAIPKSQKHQIFHTLETQIASQKAVLLITTRETKTTLNSAKNSELRSNSRKEGVVLQVCKNTLIQKAFPASPNLVGQTYMAFLEDGSKSDEVTIPKIMIKVLDKDFKDYFNIVGCVVGGEFFDADKTEALSKVPTFNDSMAMIAGSINQITAKIALTIKEIPASVARGVQAINQK